MEVSEAVLHRPSALRAHTHRQGRFVSTRPWATEIWFGSVKPLRGDAKLPQGQAPKCPGKHVENVDHSHEVQMGASAMHFNPCWFRHPLYPHLPGLVPGTFTVFADHMDLGKIWPCLHIGEPHKWWKSFSIEKRQPPLGVSVLRVLLVLWFWKDILGGPLDTPVTVPKAHPSNGGSFGSL